MRRYGFSDMPIFDQPALFMTVRREIAKSRCETGERRACQPKARRSSESAIAAEAAMNNAG
jgi:hypothetical protein